MRDRAIVLLYLNTSFVLSVDFSSLGYPKHLIDQVFSATKKKFYNPPPPLDTEKPSDTLVLPYNTTVSMYYEVFP